MTSSIHKILAAGVVRYSQVWEDHILLERGLDVGPGDDVLSIASAGDNALALLLQEPKSVLAVDVNPAQVALVELKLRAIEVLELEELMELIGASPSEQRLALYERVRLGLPARAKAYWDDHSDIVRAGIQSSGRLDIFLQGFRAEKRAELGSEAEWLSLLLASDVASQKDAFARLNAEGAVERAFVSYFTRERFGNEGRDPRQMRYVDEIDIPNFLFRKFAATLTELPARGNFYLHSGLLGRYLSQDAVPPYLQRHNYARLRTLLPRIRVELTDVKSALLAAPLGAYSKANLSDLFEYLSDEASEELFLTLGQRLRASGRIAFWNLFVPREPVGASRKHFRALRDLAAALFAEDRTMFYRAYHVEEVIAE